MPAPKMSAALRLAVPPATFNVPAPGPPTRMPKRRSRFNRPPGGYRCPTEPGGVSQGRIAQGDGIALTARISAAGVGGGDGHNAAVLGEGARAPGTTDAHSQSGHGTADNVVGCGLCGLDSASVAGDPQAAVGGGAVVSTTPPVWSNRPVLLDVVRQGEVAAAGDREGSTAEVIGAAAVGVGADVDI